MRSKLVRRVLVAFAALAAGALVAPAASADVPPQEPLAGLGGRAAWELLREQFPGPATGELRDPAAGLVVRRYLSDTVARVIEGGAPRVLVSTVPLRARRDDGSLAPTRLDLVSADGHHEPANAPFELEIADDGAGALTLGATRSDLVRITPIRRAASEAMTTAGDRMFWSDTATDVDTLVVPTASGAETFEQLRGPDAPERFEYALDLPAGAVLRLTPDGGAEVARGGEQLLRVAPPTAEDAAGADVPVRLELTAAGLAIVVDHRRAGVRYPVLADPQWVSDYDFVAGDGFEGWSAMADPAGSDWYYVFGTNSPASAGRPDASGLWIVPRGSRTYRFDATPAPGTGYGPMAMAFFQAPGNGTITRVRYHNVRYSAYEDPDTGDFDGQSLRLGVCCMGNEWSYQRDFVGPNREVDNQSFDTGPLPAGATSATVWLFTSGCGDGNNCAWSVPASNKASWTQVGGVQITLEDPEAPAVSHTGDLATRGGTWINAATGALSQTLSASDPTSGLASVASQFQLRGQGGFQDTPGVVQPSCDPNHHTPGRQGSICQQGLSQTLTWNPASLPAAFAGWISFRPFASDLAGNQSFGGVHTIWVDRTPPQAGFSGELWDARGSWLREPLGHQLRIAGTDNTVAGESGVARYRVEHSHQADAGAPTSAPATIDDFDPCPSPQPSAAPPADWQPCPSAGATRTLSGLDLPEGRNHFGGAVTDHAGNGGQPGGFDVYVDATRPALQLSGTLADLDGTWGAPEGVLDLTADASDALSGLDSVAAEVTHEGRTIANLADQRPCRSPSMPSLAPCPRAPQPDRLSVPADDLPEGSVEIGVSAADYAGNARRRTIELHVDRTPPTVALSGDILDLDRGWQDPDEPVTAVVSAADNMSGITGVELWVRDANGREQLLDREAVCDETAGYTGDGAPCPLDVMVPFSVDPTGLPDGRNTFFARATEFAGKRARDDMTVDIDNTAPNAPSNLQIAERGEDGATLSWTPGPEPAADAGIAHYVVTVVVDGVVVTENISPHPYATIGGLPPGLSVRFLIRAVDRLHRRSRESSGGLARAARFTDASMAGFSDTRAAYKLRPLILLDTKEDWRPRNIHDLFKERREEGKAAHRVCHRRPVIGDDCDDVNRPDDLYQHRESDDYLDIRGHERHGDDFVDPDLGRCTTASRKDCGSGPGSAIYFNVTRTRLHLYADYWWFFRYNDAQRGPDGPQCQSVVPMKLCFDHEGDWEGITVVTSPTSSDRIQYVSFSAHGHWFKYPVGVTSLSGKRARVYVARGTHANYPRPCADDCQQTDSSDDGIAWLPETQFDGRAPWERNSAEICAGNCLLPLPEHDRDPDTLPRGNASSFTDWPGRWGKKERKVTKKLANGPASPGRQPHYADPGAFAATPRRAFSAVARRANAAAPEAGEELAGESDCAGWLGPMVAVAACDSSAIAAALATNTLDRPGTVTLSGDADDVTGSAPGISQLLSEPLEPGDEVRVTGHAGAGTALTVRTASETGVREWRFVDPGLADGGSATVQVDAASEAAGPLLVRPDGSAVRGAPDGAAATASAPQRLRVRRRRGAVVATFVAGGTRAQVEQRRSRRGRALARTAVRTRPGRTVRVRVRLRRGARYVAVRTMGTRSSSALVRRVPRGRR